MELLVLSVILLVVIIELIGLSINKEALFNFYNTFPSCEDRSDNFALSRNDVAFTISMYSFGYHSIRRVS